MNKINPDIIFDNGGGATLQIDGYIHKYVDMDQLVDDLTAILEDDGDPIADGWDGNEIEDYDEIDVSWEDERNGGYRSYSLGLLLNIVKAGEADARDSFDMPGDGWHNVVKTLKGLGWQD